MLEAPFSRIFSVTTRLKIRLIARICATKFVTEIVFTQDVPQTQDSATLVWRSRLIAHSFSPRDTRRLILPWKRVTSRHLVGVQCQTPSPTRGREQLKSAYTLCLVLPWTNPPPWRNYRTKHLIFTKRVCLMILLQATLCKVSGSLVDTASLIWSPKSQLSVLRCFITTGDIENWAWDLRLPWNQQ